MIPFARPDITRADLEAHDDCLLRGQIDPGPRHQEFLEEIADRLGVPPAWVLLTGSGTAALEVACRQIVRGEKFVAPSLTWPSTYSHIEEPRRRYADVDKTGLMDHGVYALAVAMPVALWGRRELRAYLRGFEKNCGAVILDAAHDCLNPQHGKFVRDGIVQAVCYSFGPLKQMTCGRGGAVVSRRLEGNRDPAEAYMNSGTRNRLALLKRGRNLRMTEPAAALGLAQLARLDAMDSVRQSILADYCEHLGAFMRTIPKLYSGHLAVLQVPVWADRDLWQERLNKKGIETSVHYYVPGSIPLDCSRQARFLSDSGLSIPCHTKLNTTEVRVVQEELVKLYSELHLTEEPPGS